MFESKKKIRIAILDNATRWQGIIEEPACDFAVLNHGMICKEIINCYSHDNRFDMIKVFKGKSLKCSIDKIEHGIYRGVKRCDKIINLSLGSVCEKDYKRLDEICKFARDNETIIVAGVSNSGDFTMPAQSENVIGVDVNDNFQNNKYTWNDERRIFEASGIHKLFFGKTYYTPPCSSFAVPTIVAEIANIIKGKGAESFAEIREALINSADKY